MKRGLIVALMVLAAAGLLAGLFFTTFVRREVTEPTLPKGAALYDPYLALELTLKNLGRPVHALTALPPDGALGPNDTVLLGADAARVDGEEAARLAGWVRGGGHLLLAAPAGADGTRLPLYAALHLFDPRPGGDACVRLDTAKDAATLCGTRFHLLDAASADVDAAIGEADVGYLFARMAVGHGHVSVLSSFAPISWQGLRQPAAQAFARGLLAPHAGHGQVYLVYALDGPPFLQFLAVHGWPALLALALLLVAWMAMRSARLGPLLPAPLPQRRALLEHVQASGEFLHRLDAGRSLHRLACDAVLDRLRRRDPACAHLQGETLHARLAERSGLNAALVARAFHAPSNAQAFRASLITLARLRSRT